MNAINWARYRELNQKNKRDLCEMYRELGYVGGAHPLEKWRKDEIITGIMDVEQRQQQDRQEAELGLVEQPTFVMETYGVDVTEPYCYQVERTDKKEPVTLSWGSQHQPIRVLDTVRKVAMYEAAQSRIGHRYLGPVRVRVWAHRGDQEHYRQPVPDNAFEMAFGICKSVDDLKTAIVSLADRD